MIVRLFLSAVAPNDLERLVELFQEDIRPAFEAHPDGLGIELVRALEPGVAGLIEGGVLSRWTSAEAMNQALSTEELQASQLRARELLRRNPIRKVYEVVS